MKGRSGTLFSKTVLGALSISLTVLAAVAMILLVWFQKEMASGYRSLTRAAMRNADTVFGDRLEDAKKAVMNWFEAPESVSLRLKPEAVFTDYMSFINQTRAVLNGEEYLRSVCFINAQREMALSIGSHKLYSEKLDEPLLEELKSRNIRNEVFVWNIERKGSGEGVIPIMSIPMAEMPVGAEDFKGMVVLNIDLEQLNRSLFADSSQEKTRIFILNDAGVVIGNSNREHLGEDWSDKKWVQRVLSGEEQFEEREEALWEFLSLSSGRAGFYIVAQSEYMTRMANVNHILYLVFAVMAAAAMVMVFLMLVVSRHIFKPFTAMVGNLKQSELGEGIEAEGDEVVFLERFYRDVASHVQTLNEKREHDFIVKNLLLGTQKKEVSVLLQQKGILSADCPYYMIIVFLESKDQNTGYNMQEYDMLRSMVSNVYVSVLEKYGVCTCFEAGLRRLLFLVSGTDEEIEDEDRMRDAVRRAEETARRISRIRTFCVMSPCITEGTERCVSVFGRMNECLSTRRLLGAEQTALLSKEDERYHTGVPDRLMECLRQRDRAGYLTEVKRLLQECELMPFGQLCTRLEAVAAAVSRAGKTARNGQEKGNERENLRERIEAMGSREELWLWLEALYDEAAVWLGRMSSHSTAAMMEEAVDYIRNHYDDGSLNTNMMADRLKITPSYFGKLFMEFTGYKMLDYLLKVRMEQAGELLLSEPDKDIAWIAAAAGYNNSTYFATAFKKFYGVTPSQYRSYHLLRQTKE